MRVAVCHGQMLLPLAVLAGAAPEKVLIMLMVLVVCVCACVRWSLIAS